MAANTFIVVVVAVIMLAVVMMMTIIKVLFGTRARLIRALSE